MSRFAFLLALAVCFVKPAGASVGVIDRTGTEMKITDLQFLDEDAKVVTLDQFFHPNRPVLLTLVYFGCPGICTVTLNNLVSSLKMVNPSPGSGFEVVVVSIDARDSVETARAKKASYVKLYGRPESAKGWHFLTGDQANIDRLTERLGFQFERDASTQLINHPSALYVFNPSGKITTIFATTTFRHREIRVALFEAVEGKTQALINRLNSLLLYVYATSWLDQLARAMVVGARLNWDGFFSFLNSATSLVN